MALGKLLILADEHEPRAQSPGCSHNVGCDVTASFSTARTPSVLLIIAIVSSILPSIISHWPNSKNSKSLLWSSFAKAHKLAFALKLLAINGVRYGDETARNLLM